VRLWCSVGLNTSYSVSKSQCKSGASPMFLIIVLIILVVLHLVGLFLLLTSDHWIAYICSIIFIEGMPVTLLCMLIWRFIQYAK
jgi:hypothetical protein